MDGEFNNLEYNNTRTTFTTATNNTETSDELTAALMYQDKMGTNYSKRKRAAKVVSTAGIVLIATAASIKTGSLITNGFVLNPPKIAVSECTVSDNNFHIGFSVTNLNNYKVTYFIFVNNNPTSVGDCSTPSEYVVDYNEFQDGDKCVFYIEFSNRVDYKTKLLRINFNTGGSDYDGN